MSDHPFRGTIIAAGCGPITTRLNPLLCPCPTSNFYGNLQRHVDQYVVQVMDTIEEAGLLDDTVVIATSDHGEMGMSHGGLIQKCFNFYEETMRVPLVFSNPVLYPQPLISDALVSHVDLVPTLATLLGVPPSARQTDWQGVDFSSLLLDPQNAPPVQDYTVFTYVIISHFLVTLVTIACALLPFGPYDDLIHF